MKKALFILILTALGNNPIFSQDIHFSQYYASPLSLNPSQTGDYRGNWRFMTNYRRQWDVIATPFTTFSLGGDRQFYIKDENFSGGFLFINDKSGLIGLTANKFLFSGAYHKRINKQIFSFGLQAGYIIKSINTNVTFPGQFDMNIGQFNSSLISGENLENSKTGYFDLNAGTSWTARIGKFIPQFGIALFHLNSPEETFFSQENPLPVRHVFNTSVRYNINKKIYVYPHLLIMTQNKASEILSGANIGYNLNPNASNISSIFIGSLMRDGLNRNTDAIAVITGCTYKKFEIGISYDFTVSELQHATRYNGGLEISIIYTDLIPILDKISIPCDRF